MALSLSPAARHKLTNLLVCFSLGNLLFMRRWYDLEHLKERSMEYYRIAPADPTLLYATLLGGLIYTAILWLLWYWVERNPTPAKVRIAQCGFLLLLIYPLESVRRYWNMESDHYDFGSNIALLALEGALLAGIVMAARGNSRIVRAARRAMLLLLFFIPVMLFDFSWTHVVAAPRSAYAPKAPLPMLTPSTDRRVIWLVFDEFDARLAFELKKPAVDLPELDRLRREAFVAESANQSATWTMIALPSLVDGRNYSRVELTDADTLKLIPEGSDKRVSWSDEPNVFQRARTLGVNTALVGWHHPYCRVLGDDVVRCNDVPNGSPSAALLREMSVADEGVLKGVPFLFRLQLSVLNNLFLEDSDAAPAVARDEWVQARQQRQYFQIRNLTFASAGDPKIGLTFAHFPIPHLFGIYDRQRRDFALSASLSYADNLALVDRTVGELRRFLEQRNMWDSTTLIITSDHGLRPDVWRHRLGWTDELERLTASGQSPIVPFIVKLAGSNPPMIYERPFVNVITGDLILAILGGEVSTPADVSRWLDQHAAIPGKSVR